MKVLIAEISLRVVENFTESVGAELACAPFRISISAPQVSIIFSQPERYSRLVTCEFIFSSDVGFFYEDICAALSVCSAINTVRPCSGLDKEGEIERNNGYLIEVIEFCKANWAEIIRVPLLWYERAVEIADKKLG